MPAAANHLTDIRFSHFNFENQFATLLHLGHQYFLRRVNELLDDKLEKGLHWVLLSGSRSRSGSSRNFLARFQNHACDSCARLSAMPHPVVNTAKVQTKVFPGVARIIVADSLYEFPVARATLICHHNTVKGPVFGSFSP